MRDDPCFKCPLPDCDERSPRCVVRRMANMYDAKVRLGRADQITPAERDASARLHEFWCLDRKAEASEGGRVFRRGGTVYGASAEGRKSDRTSAGVGRPAGGAASGSERGAP